jgi:hypothetical protein
MRERPCGRRSTSPMCGRRATGLRGDTFEARQKGAQDGRQHGHWSGLRMLFLAAHPRAAPWHPSKRPRRFNGFRCDQIRASRLFCPRISKLGRPRLFTRSPPAAEGLLRRLDLGMEVVRSRIDTFRTFSYISFSQATCHQYW